MCREISLIEVDDDRTGGNLINGIGRFPFWSDKRHTKDNGLLTHLGGVKLVKEMAYAYPDKLNTKSIKIGARMVPVTKNKER